MVIIKNLLEFANLRHDRFGKRGMMFSVQAQQLFQRDAQTITPEALESVKAALASGEGEHKSDARKRAVPRKAAGLSWEDPTLADWPESMISIFIVLCLI